MIGQGTQLNTDAVAEATTQVEVVPEPGLPGHYKLYIHENGRTILRLGRIPRENLKIG